MSHPLDDEPSFWRANWPWIALAFAVVFGGLLWLALSGDGAYSPFQYAGG
ncbi:MAG: hypothetical protein R3F34_02670 [Planctomycetota bacterium]